MTDLKNSKQAWEMLPAYLNLVLIQTGKLLRDSDYRGPKAISLAKSKVNEYVSAANGSFHDALDEVEVKILDAKSVMERDLAVIRKKRALREGVKIPMPAPSPIDVPTETSKEAMQIEEPQITNSDLPMVDTDVSMAHLRGGADSDQPLLSEEGLMMIDPSLPQDTVDSAGLAISIPGELNAIEKEGPKSSIETNQDTGAKMEDIMGISTGQEPQGETDGLDLDFESMFNDANFAAADGSMDFNVDFSNTDQQANQGQPDNAFGDFAATGIDLGNAQPAANEDITGLLDDVFNQVEDAAGDSANLASTAPEGNKGDAMSAQPTASGVVTSEFDDLFGNDTFDLGADDDVTGNNNMADFDFDEEWLKM